MILLNGGMASAIRVARLKLEAIGYKIDKLTPEQVEHLAWSEGA